MHERFITVKIQKLAQIQSTHLKALNSQKNLKITEDKSNDFKYIITLRSLPS